MKTLDTRDLYKRKCELKELRDILEGAKEAVETLAADVGVTSEALEALNDAKGAFSDDEKEELDELETLENEISDFRHGETMIPENDFEDYARQLAEDIGAIPDDAQWPCTCIDWEWAARELAMDYSMVEYQGESYYVRS